MNVTTIEQAMELAKTELVYAREKMLLPHFGTVEAEVKANTGSMTSDIVTRLDGEVEDHLASVFAREFPDIMFTGEEQGVRGDGAISWLVDPIDGTAHFVRGMPFCTSMVALVEEGNVLGAAICNIATGDMYSAVKGQGAYKNGARIHVAARSLKKSLFVFESDVNKYEDNRRIQEALGRSTTLFATINSGFELTMVAEGRLDGKLVKNGFGYQWDFAPGSLIIQEAGGVVRNLGTTSFDYRNLDMVLTTEEAYQDLQQLFPELFVS